MVLTYPPQHEGGTLHFPSPTHIHNFDPTNTILQLRQSLSRSPSKSPTFRLIAAKPHSPLPSSPLSPSPLSPHRHVSRLHLPSNAFTTERAKTKTPSPPNVPLGFDLPASARTTRSSLRKLSPLRPSPRQQSMGRSRSPRRVLGQTSTSGNVMPTSPLESTKIVEITLASARTESVVKPPKVEFKGFGLPSENAGANESLQPVQHYFGLQGDRHFTDAPVKSSPLKRTDAPMKTDPSGRASPSAKRRSLHGPADFNIFDQFANPDALTSGRASPEYITPMNLDGAHAPSPVSKRTNSLRKSTLQQRHERPILNRTKASSNLSQDITVSIAPAAAAARKAVDPHRPLPTRRNLFGGEPTAPENVPQPDNPRFMEPPRAPTRHPLSRTITQSSSGSDVAQNSPTHMPLHLPERKVSQGAFARSLPIGVGKNPEQPADQGQPANGDFSTPENYKLAKPLQAVFMSTGLISKRTKTLQNEDDPVVTNRMPDTPCKRPLPLNPMAPSATPALPPRQAQLRHNVHAFGSPSSPFVASTSKPTGGAVGQGVGIFGSSIKPLNRRGSFLSVDSGDENCAAEVSLSQSFETPPTPSKALANSTTPQQTPFVPKTSIFALDLQPSVEPRDVPATTEQPATQCKLILSSPDGRTLDTDGDNMMDESPSARRRFSSLGAVPSYSGHRRPSILPGDHSPSPTPHSKRKSHTLPHIRIGNFQAKLNPLTPASPLSERYEHRSPCTPRDSRGSVAPPDPSGLSISGNAAPEVDFRRSTFGISLNLNSSVPAPATPTANRDSSRFQSHRAAQTSIHAIAEAQLDDSLTSRFDEIEMIGDGEFSSVFKVVKNAEAIDVEGQDTSYFRSFNADPVVTSKPISMARSIYAVKKSRYPYMGMRDRARKLKEVEVLRALGTANHTIQLQDHWEYASHLYIQTDYCDEGSLDNFLVEAGRNARLDDFRIWKIMLEIGLGLKHIHDSEFIHLDLKPANILITFEGTLKIADFGMATSWPAAPGIEGEGDREYIGPEILMGKFDKPADIYALGLIILEMAGNVVLPDNGVSWQRLRSGDMSDVPSLTSSSSLPAVRRDAKGRPLDDVSNNDGMDLGVEGADHPSIQPKHHGGELQSPPDFMADQGNQNSLDSLVKWMINPDSKSRPNVHELLSTIGLTWVEKRRRAGATVYEGTWGPADEVLDADAEMMDF